MEASFIADTMDGKLPTTSRRCRGCPTGSRRFTALRRSTRRAGSRSPRSTHQVLLLC